VESTSHHRNQEFDKKNLFEAGTKGELLHST
jgi:hypothetical protein